MGFLIDKPYSKDMNNSKTDLYLLRLWQQRAAANCRTPCSDCNNHSHFASILGVPLE